MDVSVNAWKYKTKQDEAEMDSVFEQNPLTLIAGAGGFIGGHLAAVLAASGHRLRLVDRKPIEQWYQRPTGAIAVQADLSQPEACRDAVAGVDFVYNLAADMGGMGFIETHKADCMLSVLINTNLLLAARDAAVRRYFFASSACVYAAGRQLCTDVVPLAEADAYPAMPEDGYGWEKLFSERMCRHFREDFGIETRIGRYHNVYGPNGTFAGGREKAPAAICRKVIEAVRTSSNEVEIWGDGEQTRSFMYIDDCVEGTIRLMASDCVDPLNIGSDELVSINRLVDMAEEIAGITLRRRYKLDAPKGVRGRNSDNRLIRETLNWSPSIALRIGLGRTYRWIESELGATTHETQPETAMADH